MSLANIKKKTEQYIIASWNETPVFFDSQEVTGMDAIHVSFLNIDRELYSSGCSGSGRMLNYTAMKIRTYSKSATKILEYQDTMNALLECLEFDDTHYELAKPDGLGSIDLKNGQQESTIDYLARTYN